MLSYLAWYDAHTASYFDRALDCSPLYYECEHNEITQTRLALILFTVVGQLPVAELITFSSMLLHDRPTQSMCA